MNRTRPRPALVRLLLCGFVCCGVAACDKPVPQSAAASAAPKTAPVPRRPGHVTGTLTDSQGKPLAGEVIASVSGRRRDKDSGHATVMKVPAGKGRYEIEVPDGSYDPPAARVKMPLGGRTVYLTLAADDASSDPWAGQQESKHGLVRNFVWRISGTVPGGDPKKPEGYWGGSVLLDKADALVSAATVELTLQPDGPLADGSAGQTIVRRSRLPWKGPEDRYLFDVPPGRYVVTARQIGPGGKATPLHVSATNGNYHQPQKPQAPAASATVAFEPRQVLPTLHTFYVPQVTFHPAGK